MKNRRLVLGGMVLLALVLTTGTFAYTYAGAAAATLNATTADGPAAANEPSVYQPDWDSLLPRDEIATEILLPAAEGDLTELDQRPDTGENWDKVTSSDDWDTFVWNDSKWEHTDLYSLSDFCLNMPITDITVYFRIAGGPGTTAYARAAIKTRGAVFAGPQQSQPAGTFGTKSYQWTTNPVSHRPWTMDDINELQAGVALQKEKNGTFAACTQVYVAVNYEFVIIEGEVPGGDLFDVTTHPDYTGDLLVKVYLTNTSSLLKTYKYLNMKLYVDNSLEAGKHPDYQILSMENGVAQFNIQGGSADDYTVQVIGGGYRLISDDPEEWGEGWSITPDFYCEVTQR